jgi:WD40 repeat protein
MRGRNFLWIVALILSAPGLAGCKQKQQHSSSAAGDQPQPVEVFEQKDVHGITGLHAIGDGRLVAFGDADGVIRLWDPAKGGVEDELLGPGPIQQLTGDSKGKWLACAYENGQVLVWDLQNKNQTRIHVEGVKAAWPLKVTGTDALFLRDLSIAEPDKRIHVWSVSDARVTRSFEGHRRPLSSAAVMADGSRIVSGDIWGEVIVWEADTGRVLHRMPTDRLHDNVTGVHWIDFLGRSSLFATGNSPGINVIIWDAEDGSRKMTLDLGSYVGPLVASPDGKRLVVTTGGWVTIWDTESGQKIQEFLAQEDSAIGALTFAQNGKLLVTTSHPHKHGNGKVKTWKIE